MQYVIADWIVSIALTVGAMVPGLNPPGLHTTPNGMPEPTQATSWPPPTNGITYGPWIDGLGWPAPNGPPPGMDCWPSQTDPVNFPETWIITPEGHHWRVQ